MEQPPTKRRGPLLWLAGRSRRFWLCLPLLLPVLYVASFGPMCRLWTRNVLWWDSATTFYQPCFDLALNGPAIVRHPLRWWVDCCDGEGILKFLELRVIVKDVIAGDVLSDDLWSAGEIGDDQPEEAP